ncbi:MAG: hypothetical protein EOM55_03820 [Clostridia bacterium]|nr:hypothetical protein [Clostridia bacterium]
MKILQKILISISLVLFLPLFLFACDEATFESTPWASSTKTMSEVVDKVENCRNYMMDDLYIPVTYETTTIFRFFETEDGEYENKTVKEVSTATFSSASIEDATAEIVTKTYENGELLYIKTSTYVRTNDDNGFIYILKTTYDSSTSEEGSVYMQREKLENDFSDKMFYTMLGEIIHEAEENEAEIVSEKSFDDIQYYKLTSNVFNLNETIQDKFIEKSDLFSNPELFAMGKKGDDFVMPFSYEYGITKFDYINYFALNYTIGNSNSNGQSYENYLTVSSVTVLKNYGNAVEIPAEPENIDDYTVATFDNVVKSDEYFVVYTEDIDGGHYRRITTQKRTDKDILVKVEEINSGAVLSSLYYFIDFEESNFTVYSINVENQTYSEQEGLTFNFLNFNYSLQYFTKTSDGAYQYGSSEAHYLIRLQNGEVFSITNSKAVDAVITFIGDENYPSVIPFGEGNNGITLYDLTGLTEVE